MNKEQFALIFELSRKAPWLANKSKELTALLFDDCHNDCSRDLLIDLITRFKYIDREQYTTELKTLADKIIQEIRLTPESTQIIAMAADESSDSSQYILYDLKMIFHNANWSGYGAVNLFGKAYQKYKKNNSYKNLVLVDEFIGSGKTVISRVTELHRVFKQANVTDYRVIVMALVASSVGMTNIKNSGIEVYANHVINKGISDHYPQESVAKKISLMKDMEGILAPFIDKHELPSMGYGGCESLYIREAGNTPNCVFPFFWWPKYPDGLNRTLIMERAL